MNKKLIKLTESDLHRLVKESVHKILREQEEGIYGFPKLIDFILLGCENDRECHELYRSLESFVWKKTKKGVVPSFDLLANSSMMKNYQQLAFRKFKAEQIRNGEYDRVLSPKTFREYKAKEIMDDINIRLTESDLHNIVKESVDNIISNGEMKPIFNPKYINIIRAVRNLVDELEKVGADEDIIEQAWEIERQFVDSYGDTGITDEILNQQL